jgi:broad specificity phosphatase PhoE
LRQKLKLIPTPHVTPHVTLYFETHSTSLDNEAGLASGWFDVDLSPRGEEQARELGRRYADVPLGHVYASDLKRAARTAEIAFGGRVPVAHDARLRECDYGDLTREPTAVIEAQRLNRIRTPFPNGESYDSCVARVASFLDERASGSAPILIVGHRATWYALEHLLRGRALAEVITAPWQWQPGWEYHTSSDH